MTDQLSFEDLRKEAADRLAQGVDTPPSHDVPHARSDDLWTSHASAQATEVAEGTTSVIRPRTGKHIALSTIARGPRTSLEVERFTGKRGIWKRVSDLKNAGLVDVVGHRRDVETGREGIVWGISEKGARVLAELDRGEAVRV